MSAATKSIDHRAAYRCRREDERGSREASASTCGTCRRTWCDNCDPTPASLCPWCCGIGRSTAPLRELNVNGVRGYVDARKSRTVRR